MSAEPTYPEDAPVGGAEGKQEAAEKANAEKANGETADADVTTESKRTRQIVTGAAIGIGSAALVAALLYANRSRGGKKVDEK